MKIVIEVPVDVDGKLSDQEVAKLKRHLRTGIPVLREQLQREILNPGPRMLGTICRFRYGRPEIKVEGAQS